MRFLRWLGKRGALLMTLIWVLIVTLEITAPLLYKAFPKESYLIYTFLKPLCHQNIERSFILDECKMGLCARCTGIFAGLAIFGIVALIVKPKKGFTSKIFFIIISPLVLDGLAQTIGLWNTGNIPRFLTGVAASFGIVFFIYPIIFEANQNAGSEPRKRIYHSELK